ncbi:FkbM family methyltransferase [Candidatus Nitrotoga fabula]|nr:FkbM family methyltransferase [Candidatus Nitrotoga fabula]
MNDLIDSRNERPMVYLGGNRALTKTIYGHKIIVDTRDLSLAPHILIDGYWERWITNVFSELILPGMVVLEIGANVGYYSLLAADKIGASGKLICFEANPELSDLIFYNLAINGFGSRSEVVNKAVYSEDTILTFKIYEKFLGGSSLWGNDEQAKNYRDKIKRIQVDGVRLDSHFKPGTRIDFIKIDAEGAEPYILKGASRILSENPHVIIMFEFSPKCFILNMSVEIFYNEWTRLGFKMYRIEPDSTLSTLTLADAIATSTCDVILKGS